MITKFGRVDLEPDRVRAIFMDTENWPLWMPGIEQAQTLQQGATGKRLALRQRLRGRAFEMDLDCRFSPERLRFVQLQGSLRRWDSSWRFDPSPDGSGTTVTFELEMELGGLLGLLATERVMDGFLDQLFNETLHRLHARGRELGADQDAEPAPPGADVLLRVYQTEQGLELWYDGQRYQLPPREPGRQT